LGKVSGALGNVIRASVKVLGALEPEPGYHVKVDGEMMGMDAIRIDYQRIGSTAWPLAAFLTKMPGEFVITPQPPANPSQAASAAST
jgi:hypothetical protein